MRCVSFRTAIARGAALWIGSLTVTALVVPLALLLGGAGAAVDATLAAAVCLGAATTSWALRAIIQGPSLAIHGVMLGMIARMGIPLGFAAAYCLRPGGLGNQRFLYYLLGFYLLTLVIDTVVSLPGKEKSSAASGRARERGGG
jgi:hypothetical protein